ncbi:MAG: T9SS type A sorting domain-containing protein, partial [Phycisphaerae bacterium]|nr:T9SS type A sorting domain-containing protein [candidate division KSB1 bacterium]NIV00266.1 T9SS type A sorting domain-containing protein [Phycisphaerae bacterium]NIT70209.1 T9SS type A sorting domain-containing protein [candidate division KSB1 bacterium]NIU23861.1 T9SS type A sorting domain-containing protein [candidate division KSB1 bacterium]NIV69126.1 T9SS type A sorting domain-containing protein [Phycisphaerae bacterium]
SKSGSGGAEDWLPKTAGEEAMPEEFVLEQNYPNPFNPSTVIRYSLNEDSHVKLTIYNTLGQEIATLVDEMQNAGFQAVSWNGTDNSGQPVSAGVYLYKLEAGKNVEIKKLTFVK